MKNKKENEWTNGAASKLAKIMLRVQNKFAAVMNKRVNRFSQRKIKILLVVFCLLGGGWSVYLGAHALFGRSQIPVINVTPVQVPKVIDQQGREEEGIVNDEMYLQIQRYKCYMDSLQLKIRPGLLDSIKLLEEIYKNQQR